MSAGMTRQAGMLRETIVTQRDENGAIVRTLAVERSSDTMLISRKEFAALQRDMRRLSLVVEALRSALGTFGVDLSIEGGRVRTRFNERARELSQR